MKALEEKILKEGTVLDGDVLKVGSFLNQQIDTDFLFEIGNEVKRIYSGLNVNKILTVEASGIALAVAAGMVMRVPVVFAKKSATSNVSGKCYSTVVHSYTHNTDYNIQVPVDYLNKTDRIVIVDDFLANGKALNGLIDIISQSGATLLGATCAIEKAFQGGGDKLREKGVMVESLAVIEKMSPQGIAFRK